jgi:transcriptional regulator with XRE-family HTH domain
MAQKTSPLLPSSADRLSQFGERLRLARRRRNLTSKQVAERAGMAPVTLRNLERGSAGVTIGAYLAVMQVLGIDRDLDLIAKDDIQGRDLQDARLPHRRAKPVVTAKPAGTAQQPTASSASGTRLDPGVIAKDTDWVADSDFVSGNALVSLIVAPKPGKRGQTQ